MMINKREEKTYDNTDDHQIDKKRENTKEEEEEASRKKREIKTPHYPTWAWA